MSFHKWLFSGLSYFVVCIDFLFQVLSMFSVVFLWFKFHCKVLICWQIACPILLCVPGIYFHFHVLSMFSVVFLWFKFHGEVLICWKSFQDDMSFHCGMWNVLLQQHQQNWFLHLPFQVCVNNWSLSSLPNIRDFYQLSDIIYHYHDNLNIIYSLS